MHCHFVINNRAPRWTFTDPCKPEVRPGAREESASPAWLAAPAINARDTTKVYIWRLDTGCGLTLYIGSVTAKTTQEKGIITLESNPSRGTVLPAPHGKGNKLSSVLQASAPGYFMNLGILLITGIVNNYTQNSFYFNHQGSELQTDSNTFNGSIWIVYISCMIVYRFYQCKTTV